MVEGHGDERGSVGVRSGGVESFPTNWAVLAVILDAPGAGLGGDQRLVAVVVVLEELRGRGDVDAARH